MTERVPLNEKYMLTIREAAVYFNLGQKKIRRLAEETDENGDLPPFAVFSGSRCLILRTAFELFLKETREIP